MSILLALALSLQSGAMPNIPVSIPDAVRNADCDDPAQREAVWTAYRGTLSSFGPAMRQSSRALEERQVARRQRLIERGLWTAADGERFAAALVARPDFTSYLRQSRAMATALTALLRSLTAAGATATDQCRSAVQIAVMMERAPAIANAGWQAIDAAYAEEAARLGTTID